MTDDPRLLVEALEKRNEHAGRLAMLASAAVQVEPELLRALRHLIPVADAGAEVDLWLSDLVETRGALGMTLRPDVRHILQQKLKDDTPALDAVAEVLDRIHREVSDVIRIEEQVTLESLRNRADTKDRINDLLAPVVATLENERHQGLARWAIRVFDSVPELAKATESMWRLMRSSSVARAVAGTGTASATAPVESVLSSLPKRKVALRLRKDALELEAAQTERRPVVVFRGSQHLPDLLKLLTDKGFDATRALDLTPQGDEKIFRVSPSLDSADAYLAVIGGDGGWALDTEIARALAMGVPVGVFALPLTRGSDSDTREWFEADMKRLREHVTAAGETFKGVGGFGLRSIEDWADGVRNRLRAQSRSFPDASTIELPDTSPLVLEVSWDDRNERKSQRLAFSPGETVEQPLRPRNVSVLTIAAEGFAIEPELELEDYAIVIGIEQYTTGTIIAPQSSGSARLFSEWLLAQDGGRVPRPNMAEVRTADDLEILIGSHGPNTRRTYVLFAGAVAMDEDDRVWLRTDGQTRQLLDLRELHHKLERSSEEFVLIVDAVDYGRPETGERLLPSIPPWPFGPSVMIVNVRNPVDELGPITPVIIEGLRGGAADRSGTITGKALGDYVVERHSTARYTGGDLVLRKNVFTTVSLRFPREMFGSEVRLLRTDTEPIVHRVADDMELTVVPGAYDIYLPEHDYWQNITFNPGHNEVTIGWRPNGRWVIVAGTSRALREEESIVCEAVARALADHGFSLIVGIFAGVDELAAKVFADRVRLLGGDARDLLRGGGEVLRQYMTASAYPQFKIPGTRIADDDFEAPLHDAEGLILIGGAEGTYEYARRARERGVPVYAIAETGGAAAAVARERQLQPSGQPITREKARDIAEEVVALIKNNARVEGTAPE